MSTSHSSFGAIPQSGERFCWQNCIEKQSRFLCSNIKSVCFFKLIKKMRGFWAQTWVKYWEKLKPFFYSITVKSFVTKKLESWFLSNSGNFIAIQKQSYLEIDFYNFYKSKHLFFSFYDMIIYEEVWKSTYDHMNKHFAFFLSQTWIMIEYCTLVNDHISKD